MDLEFWFMLLAVSLVIAFFVGGAEEGISSLVFTTFGIVLLLLLIRFITRGGLQDLNDLTSMNCTGICGGVLLILVLIGFAGGGGGGPRLQYVMGRGVETVYDIGFKKE